MRALVILVALAGTANAHGMRMGSLHIQATSPTHAIVRWTTTVPNAPAMPRFPADCTATPLSAQLTELVCPQGLPGAQLAIDGLGPVITEATAFVQFSDGTTASHVLVPGDASWTLPHTSSGAEVGLQYIWLGLDHIAHGADHLLFLVLLALLLRRPRDVLLAETAFTLSHSLSFTATALGWIHVPGAPAEACIALSLVICAYDVEGLPTTNRNAGVLLAFVFGFVHGLGFAGGLHDLGVPDAHAAWALLGFGAGVELGQVLFLAVILVGITLAARWRGFTRSVPIIATAIGALATAWLIERLFALAS